MRPILIGALLISFLLIRVPSARAELRLMQVFVGAEQEFDLCEDRNCRGASQAIVGPGEFISASDVTPEGAIRIPAYDFAGDETSLFAPSEAVGANMIEMAQPRTRIYIDLPKGKTVNVERDAKQDPIVEAFSGAPIATLNNKSEIYVVGSVFVERRDEARDQNVMRNIYQIRVKQKDGKFITGWLDSGYTSLGPREDKKRPVRLPLEATGAPDPDCPDESRSVTGKVVDTVTGLVDKVIEFGTGTATDAVMPHVGACLARGPKVVATQALRRKVVEQYADANSRLPAIKKADGSLMKPEDWAAIDVMARTLYGEILGYRGECFNRGDQYPRAVAKIILNRKDLTQSSRPDVADAASSRFLKSDAPKDFPPLVRLMISPSQFNIWDGSTPSRMALCPPSSPKKKFYMGSKPPDREVEWWRQAVAVATEAVVDEKAFKARNADMKAFYYTSNMKRGSDFTRVHHATSGGENISYDKCLMIWEEKSLKTTIKSAAN